MTGDRFEIGAATHVGRVRTMNEDSYAVTEQVFAVADGMGGHLAGEVASAMAAEAMRRLEGHVSADDVVKAVIGANHAILDLSRNDASHHGMGTTLTGMAVVRVGDEDRIAVVNVGDSRTYRLRAGRLHQISIDHSYVQELVNAGHITAAEARVHPQRNIVTRALGIEAAVGIDIWTLPLVKGDRYLACSDGLVDEVLDETICDVLCDFPEPQAAAEELVRLANEHGGRDNTTVVVVDVVDGLERDAVDDAKDVLTYITVRGNDVDATDDATIEDEYDSTSTDPAGMDRSDDDWASDSDSTRNGTRSLGVIDDPTPDDANPPADLTAAILSHGRDRSGKSLPYLRGDDSTDETPLTAMRRAQQRARANSRFIAGGITVALIAVLLVILTSVFGNDSKSQTPTTDSVAITDPATQTTDTIGDVPGGTIGDVIDRLGTDPPVDTNS